MAIKMMVCCASGAGSSLLMKMTTQKAIDNLGISVS
ncbi:MAG TPA: PTS ascorbate transporter subunit IIB, partial [Kandleria vitulina]|nr:PTS ascorbate transporter subunit IIB [Kandleria vitulina]